MPNSNKSTKYMKRLRSVLITIFLVVVTNIAISYAGGDTQKAGSSLLPDAPRPKAGSSLLPDAPRPKAGSSLLPDAPRPKAGSSLLPDAPRP